MIFIVDDDIAMAENCSMFLEGNGFEVTVAASGADALAHINGATAELVISDCAMPGMSGTDLSASLRANPATAGCPILLMSASLRCDVAQGSDYDAFLRKPFMAEKLLTEVQALLDAARANKKYLKV